MLAELLGSANKERVLIYLAARGRGYSRQIARFFDASLNPVQNAMGKLEAAGVLVSRAVGNTVEYELNPRYPARGLHESGVAVTLTGGACVAIGSDQ